MGWSFKVSDKQAEKMEAGQGLPKSVSDTMAEAICFELYFDAN